MIKLQRTICVEIGYCFDTCIYYIGVTTWIKVVKIIYSKSNRKSLGKIVIIEL